MLAEHRGHGLGRWLKAENLREALAAEPRLAAVETFNAESNRWMLALNVGFAPHVAYEAWQAAIDDVREAVGGSGSGWRSTTLPSWSPLRSRSSAAG